MATSFYDRLQQHLQSGDADGITSLYHDDAEMLSFEFGTKRGRDAIRDQYVSFFDFHGTISSVEPDRTVEEEGKLFTEFTMESERGSFQLVNAFVLDGDRARIHFTNVVEGEVEADESEG